LEHLNERTLLFQSARLIRHHHDQRDTRQEQQPYQTSLPQLLPLAIPECLHAFSLEILTGSEQVWCQNILCKP
jgi:hypothetical protein